MKISCYSHRYRGRVLQICCERHVGFALVHQFFGDDKPGYLRLLHERISSVRDSRPPCGRRDVGYPCDTDGPKELGPNDGYNWRGLDDDTDWGFLGSLIYLLPTLGLAANIVGIIFFLLIYPLLSLFLVVLLLVCSFWEAFDYTDWWYICPENPDGL